MDNCLITQTPMFWNDSKCIYNIGIDRRDGTVFCWLSCIFNKILQSLAVKSDQRGKLVGASQEEAVLKTQIYTFLKETKMAWKVSWIEQLCTIYFQTY